MQEVGVSAATDVTGFGLIGHLYEMTLASDVTVEYASMGLIPAGAYSNRDYLIDKVEYTEEIDTSIKDLLFSPETAGGLLIAVSAERAEPLLTKMKQKNCACFEVGRVISKGFKPIKILK